MTVYCAFLLLIILFSIRVRVIILAEFDLTAASGVAVVKAGFFKKEFYAYLYRGEDGVMMKVGKNDAKIKSPPPLIAYLTDLILFSSQIRADIKVKTGGVDYDKAMTAVAVASGAARIVERTIAKRGEFHLDCGVDFLPVVAAEADIGVFVTTSGFGIAVGVVRFVVKKLKRSI